jgi:peptidoglycan/xylan/chitin deacetylase (PgdA/CDA1 family)
MWEEDERRMIEESRDVLAHHAGVAPRGWLGPYIAQSAATPDLLREAGFRYVMDWPADDQPFWMATRAGPPAFGALFGGAERQPGPAGAPAHLAATSPP